MYIQMMVAEVLTVVAILLWLLRSSQEFNGYIFHTFHGAFGGLLAVITCFLGAEKLYSLAWLFLIYCYTGCPKKKYTTLYRYCPGGYSHIGSY